jgi:metal-responsive CopG/Arc/MetJ family transcriptional regulator
MWSDTVKSFSVKAPEMLIKNFDICVRDSPYGSRSEAIRDLMRRYTEAQAKGRVVQFQTT